MGFRRAAKFAASVGFGAVCGATNAFASLAPNQTSVRAPLDPVSPWDYNWDRAIERGLYFSGACHGAHPAEPALEHDSDERPRTERQLILIRHGHYQNEHSKDEAVRCLTPLGENQAAATGRYLADMLEGSDLLVNTSIARILSSDMTRAQQTAEIIRGEVEARSQQVVVPQVEKHRLLRELCPCDPIPHARNLHARSLKASANAAEKAEAAFESFIHRPRTAGPSTVEIIVGHSALIRWLVCRALQLPPEAWIRLSLPHCSFTVLRLSSDGTVKLAMLGSVTHLPCELHSTANQA